MAGRTGPVWLKPLLEGNYFDHCGEHLTASKNERNFFCLSCVDGPLCHLCVDRDHLEHKRIQIFRSSYCDAVRIEDINDAVNLSGMQRYKINNKSIVFLNARPQAKQQKGVSHACEACDRMLIDPVRFCSLGCKMIVAERDPLVTLTNVNSGLYHQHSIEKGTCGDTRLSSGTMGEKRSYSGGKVRSIVRTSSIEKTSKKRERADSDPEPPSTPDVKKAHRRKGVPKASPAPGEYVLGDMSEVLCM